MAPVRKYIVTLTEIYKVEVYATSRTEAKMKVDAFGGSAPVSRKETVRLARPSEYGSEAGYSEGKA